ncbi:MAG: hypothetical protein IKI84_01525 [Clostridia bacterium]|nr:hypothetical protein [Clostridia bacterium]
MKALLFLIILALLPFSFACAEGAADPFEPIRLDISAVEASAAEPLVLRGMDFGDGAKLLRLLGATDSEMFVAIYVDGMEGRPAVNVKFMPRYTQRRCAVDLEGVHDLYIKVSGSGVFSSLQAFADEKDFDAAVRAERGVRYDDAVPAWVTRECPRGGTVEKFTYAAHDWFSDEKAVYEKSAYVYLPRDLDPEKPCGLMILCHGIGGSEVEWGLNADDSMVKKIMDNLIDGGVIRPFIVVTPNGRAGNTGEYGAFYLFDRELREDLLPALREKYAVDITDRDSCAMAGLSMGGMQTINLGIGKCLDLFSYFGAFSAAPTSNPAAVTAGILKASGDLPIRMFYSVCGTEDNVALSSARAAADGLDGMTDALNEGNFVVQYIPGGHDFSVWYLGFYNFAMLFGGAGN